MIVGMSGASWRVLKSGGRERERERESSKLLDHTRCPLLLSPSE